MTRNGSKTPNNVNMSLLNVSLLNKDGGKGLFDTNFFLPLLLYNLFNNEILYF